ncbi:hypothetical protein ACOMHN_067002 [Nucella lapillus]
MDIQQKKTQSRKDYEKAVFVLKTIQEGKHYGNLQSSKTKQIDMVQNCIQRIGLAGVKPYTFAHKRTRL